MLRLFQIWSFITVAIVACSFAMAFIIPSSFRSKPLTEEMGFVCGTPILSYSNVFKENCAACHGMDRMLIGPVLQDVFIRRDSNWVVTKILNPKALVDAGDTATLNLQQEFETSCLGLTKTVSQEELKELLVFLQEY